MLLCGQKEQEHKRLGQQASRLNLNIDFIFGIVCSMQLHTGAEHFRNVIFQYSELTSQYHIDASIHVNRTSRSHDKTILSQSGTVAARTVQFQKVNSNNPYK